jgi:hypothetical protein
MSEEQANIPVFYHACIASVPMLRMRLACWVKPYDVVLQVSHAAVKQQQ